MRPFWPSAVTAILVWVAALSSQAAPVTYEFSGVVTQVPAIVAGAYQVGDAISGQYTVHTDAVDLDSSSSVGSYILSVENFQAQVGSYSLTGVFRADLQVVNGSPWDGYGIYSVVNGPEAAGPTPALAALELMEGAEGVFASDSIPVVVNPADFAKAEFRLNFATMTDFGRLVGRVDKISIVPEPSSLSALVVALGTCLARRRTRR